MKINDIVKCLDTKRYGVVLEISRSTMGLYVLVAWPAGNRWVDACDIEVVP